MTVLCTDVDPLCVRWMADMSAAGHLDIDEVWATDIRNIPAQALVQYRQVHLFAGIGGWPLALQMAGVPRDANIWTGSCPCQPFSQAGKRKGNADDRHLWPSMRDLIAKCRPAIVFGEQVASADGRAWLATVRADMEALGYAFGAADLCAAGVGAPHIRQRLYWLAYANSDGREAGRHAATGMGYGRASDAGGGSTLWLGDANDAGPQGRGISRHSAGQRAVGPAGLDAWSAVNWHACTDGIFPGGVGVIKGAGNAIVPQLAATFITASLAAIHMGSRS